MTSDLGGRRGTGVDAAVPGSGNGESKAGSGAASRRHASDATRGATDLGGRHGVEATGNGSNGRATATRPSETRAANILASGEPSPLDGFEFRPHNCFACGELNAHGLHLELHLEPGSCWTEVALSPGFEGWEGVIHGGILCTILDEVMAWSLVEQDNWGVTARMNVEFRRPVTVGQPIRAEGWITEDRRRVHKTSGRIVDADSGQELVKADAVYVAAPEDKKRELKQRYAYREERAEGVRAARAAANVGQLREADA